MSLRAQLVATALAWQDRYGIDLSITSALAEYDAAITILGMDESQFGHSLSDATALQRGFDFWCGGLRYQVKASRPSGKFGSKVTTCPKALNYNWDRLIWILYNQEYEIQEAWIWEPGAYRAAFNYQLRVFPDDMRRGACLYYHISSHTSEETGNDTGLPMLREEPDGPEPKPKRRADDGWIGIPVVDPSATMAWRSRLKNGRALLGLSISRLMKETGLSRNAILDVESLSPRSGVNEATLERMQRALEIAGVEFIPENGSGAGVRLKKGLAQ